MTDLINHLWAWSWCLVPIGAAVLALLVVRSNRRDKSTSRDWWLERARFCQDNRDWCIERGMCSQAGEWLKMANSCLDAAERR